MKRVLALIILLLLVVGAGVYWLYSTGPRRTAERWIQCNPDYKSLMTREDQSYWEEAKKLSGESLTEIYREACLGRDWVQSVEIDGATAVVAISAQRPDLTWDEMTEFPATATRSEKISLIRERAEGKEMLESSSDLELVIDGFKWRVKQGLKDFVAVEREMESARNAREESNYKQAISLYETLLEDDSLSDESRNRVLRNRVAALAEKACAVVARRYVKYPDSTGFTLSGYSRSPDAKEIHVSGEVSAPNSFGVKTNYFTGCDVTFSGQNNKVMVDLSMIPKGGGASLIKEDGVEVAL